jgi:hypothetical protein
MGSLGPVSDLVRRVRDVLPDVRRDLEDPDFGPDLRSREGQVQAMALQIQPG